MARGVADSPGVTVASGFPAVSRAVVPTMVPTCPLACSRLPPSMPSRRRDRSSRRNRRPYLLLSEGHLRTLYLRREQRRERVMEISGADARHALALVQGLEEADTVEE